MSLRVLEVYKLVSSGIPYVHAHKCVIHREYRRIQTSVS